jgi:ribose 5-phosphate isomerase B
MRIAVAGDHAGLDLKNAIAGWLKDWGHQVSDLGAHGYDRDDDYPDFADAVAKAVAAGTAERGIICCGSGVGASIAANKVQGVRAAMCHDTYSAHQGVEHDDMNVLCVGGRVIGPEVAREVVLAFLGAKFTGEERHRRRLNKVLTIEARGAKRP